MRLYDLGLRGIENRDRPRWIKQKLTVREKKRPDKKLQKGIRRDLLVMSKREIEVEGRNSGLRECKIDRGTEKIMKMS